MKKSTLLHLRIPFSFFLLPVFLLGCVLSQSTHWQNLFLCFLLLHFLVYPASNGYNSYFDKDEKSIGGLRNPPKVSRELYYTSLLLDLVALMLSFFISIEFTLMVFVYGLASKAYSHPSIRLKKYPIVGWLTAGIFQGYFTCILSVMAIEGSSFFDLMTWSYQLPAVLSSVLLLGSYPMTQIYQHEEDAKRGDLTLSRLLGVRGTFHFTAIAFSLASVGFFIYFASYISLISSLAYLFFLSPVLVYFGLWYLKVRKDETQADFDATMKLNAISSLMLNLLFMFLWLTK